MYAVLKNRLNQILINSHSFCLLYKVRLLVCCDAADVGLILLLNILPMIEISDQGAAFGTITDRHAVVHQDELISWQ